MSDQATISGPDGEFSAYVARPQGEGPWPAGWLQDIFGVNHVMRETAEALAGGDAHGGPGLFWLIRPASTSPTASPRSSGAVQASSQSTSRRG